jgi:hypothetical protein
VRTSYYVRGILLALACLQLAFHLATADGEFSGDDHYALWVAESLWHGEVLNQDVYDPGSPLQTLIAYAGQLATGHRPLGELLIAAICRTGGIVCVYLLVLRLTGRRWIAVVPPALIALLLLNSVIYASDRLLMYPLAVLLAWRYLERPGSQVPLAILAAAAFLIRHDHGLYIGGPLLLTIIMARRSPVPFVALAAALVLPWLAWVQWHEGVVSYFTTRVDFSIVIGLDRQRPGFGFAPGSLVSQENLLRFLWQVPIVVTAAALALAVWRRDRHVIVLTVTAALMEAGIMRDVGFHPEVAGLWLPAGAWLATRARRPPAVALSAAAAAVIIAAIVVSTNAAERVPQIALENGGLLARVATAFEVQSTLPPIDVYAPLDSIDERLIVRYVYECLNPDDRVWETSQWFPLPYQSQRRAVEHLYWRLGFRHQFDADFAAKLQRGVKPPLIVIREVDEPLQAFARYPVTQEIVRREYEPITSPRFERFRETVDVQLMKHKDRPATATFAPLDLPCFRG